MNIVVIGPQMECRLLPSYSLRPVPKEHLTAIEILVTRIGKEIYTESTITIIGLPWVNPRGRGKPTALISDYLDDPVFLHRALEVAFISPRTNYRADGAVIVSDITLTKKLTLAKEWVNSHLASTISPDHLVWHSFDPDYQAIFGEINSDQTIQDLATHIKLTGSNNILKQFRDTLSTLFQ